MQMPKKKDTAKVFQMESYASQIYWSSLEKSMIV